MYSGTFLIVCYFIYIFFHLVLLATRAFCVLTSPRRSIYSIDASTQQTFHISITASLSLTQLIPAISHFFPLPKQNTPRIFLILFLYRCPEDGTCVIRPTPPPSILKLILLLRLPVVMNMDEEARRKHTTMFFHIWGGVAGRLPL